MIRKIGKIIHNPGLIFLTLGNRGLFNWMDDEKYLRIAYKIRMGRDLNLRNPETFNEKLQWLKLHDHNNMYVKMVDKYEVKELVGALIGEQYIIKTLGIWESFDDIDFNSLPEQFVLKCTHDSGGLVICKDKKTLDLDYARRKLNKSMKKNYFFSGREWPYKNVKPRIIAEEYMEDPQTKELRDYKFMLFNGKPKIMFVASDRQNQIQETHFDYFDMEYNHLNLQWVYKNADVPPNKPESFELMKSLAEKIGANIPHVRIDFYEVDGKVYFGEATFYHQSGMAPLDPIEWDYELGSWIELPNAESDKL